MHRSVPSDQPRTSNTCSRENFGCHRLSPATSGNTRSRLPVWETSVNPDTPLPPCQFFIWATLELARYRSPSDSHHEASQLPIAMASINQPVAVAVPGDVELQGHPPDDITIVLEDEPSRPSARPAIFRSTVQEILFIFTATMSVAMPSFLQGSTLVVSSFIKRDLNMTTSQLTWMTASSA